MNMTDELATWISNGDVAVFSRIWTRSGLIRGDPKFGQGLGMSPLYMWSASVCMGCVSFMSTGYMYHGYDLRIGDWMMILISTGDVAVLSPFNTKHTYRCRLVDQSTINSTWQTYDRLLVDYDADDYDNVMHSTQCYTMIPSVFPSVRPPHQWVGYWVVNSYCVRTANVGNYNAFL